MTVRATGVFKGCLAVAAWLASSIASAHSASDAYLTLTADTNSPPVGTRQIVAQGQWDIALRDLDFVLGLDDNGDGNIVWGELRKHQKDISRYVYSYLSISGDAQGCSIEPAKQMVDYHADGAYAAMFFNVVCKNKPLRLKLDYRLFFAIDPSHRAIFVMHSGQNVATAVLSPDNTHIELDR
jgi:hypothetical protein